MCYNIPVETSTATVPPRETGFYYLQSRYYDPSIGRFINADSFASTGQGFVGYNVFAYCNNNPTNLTDSSGNLPTWFEDGLKWLNNKVDTILKVAEDIWTDIVNFDIDNQSEQKVLDSNYFSYYKGCMVFRTDGNRSGSFGALFITRETNNREHPEDMVRHEYGHTLQLKELGVINYTLCIGIPSYFEWGSGEYYSKPWEITADAYGRVLYRNHDTSDIMDGFAYLDTSKKIGPLIWLFIDG